MKWLAAALTIVALAAGACRDAAAAEIRAPPVRYDLQVLPNGLKVYSVVDHSRPTVAVQVWYQVGSKDDPPGRTGLAHLFEHLMYKGSPGLPAEYMDEFTESVGGSSNASTTDDYTAYADLAPSAELERVLWAEAARMNALALDKAGFEAERSVVEEEVREALTDDPYGRLFMQDIPQASFAARAFRQSPAGTLRHLQAVTLADVAAFKALFYRPDNAVLIVVGDFDAKQLHAWVDRYFGGLRAPNLPAPRVVAREPPRRSARRVAVGGRGAPAPAVVLSYAGPSAGSPDAAALRLLDAILTGGDQARGVAALVQRRRLASEVFSEADLRRDTGLIYFGAIMAPGRGAAEGEAALRRELAWLRGHQVSQAELEAARNQLLADALGRRETFEGLAGEIGQAALVGGDAAQVNTALAALQAVTPAEVQRVARRYYVDRRRVTIRYGGGPSRRDREPAPAIAPSLRMLAALPPVHVPQPAVAPHPMIPDWRAPAPVDRTLSNGLRVLAAPSCGLPLATAVMTFAGGARLDPPGRRGLTELTAALALRGAGGRSAQQISAALARLGLKLSATVGRDSTTLELTGLSASLPQGLALLADVVRRPSDRAADLRQLRAERAEDATDVSADELADLAVETLIFGRDGRRASRRGPATQADVVRQHRRLWRPDRATLVVAGAAEPRAVFALAQTLFGDWRNPPGPPPASRPEPAPRGKPRVVVIDLPGAQVAEVAVAAPAIAGSVADRAALEIANTALGGGASSRLSREIRVKRGLSYDISSDLDLDRNGGLFSVRTETRNAAAPEVAGLILDALRTVAAERLTADELTARKAALLGDYGRRAETTVDFAELLAEEAVDGAPPVGLPAHAAAIRATDAAEVRQAAARLADPGGLQVVILGDVKRFRAALAARFPDAEVIGADDLSRVRAPGAG